MTQPDWYAGYPNYPAFAGTQTSEEAADFIKGRRKSLQIAVYAALKDKPRTCEEIENDLGIKHQTAGPRIRELALGKHIKPSGLVRKTSSGRNAIVWEVCDG